MSHLRAVGPGDSVELPPPTTLSEAAGRGRREFLMMAREKIASEIDAGVPPHALGRLIGEMDRLDIEVRRIDAAEKQEADRRVEQSSQRRSFNASAI